MALLSFTDRRVLLTGAGGSIGAGLAREILSQKPQSLLLLDHSESNLHQLNFELNRASTAGPYRVILGNVADDGLVSEIFEEEQPDFVLHAAAFKHVPLLETNVIAAVQNNALATHQLAKLAAAYEVPSLVMVSSDKAADPHSVMGATKRIAELALLRWTTARSSMRAVRLGNVLGSQGSVVPVFLQQIAAGGPVTVTHPEAARYFLSMEETIELIVQTAGLTGESGIFVPQPRELMAILGLAKKLIQEAGGVREIPIVVTGLRPGDKLNDQFVSSRESASDGPHPAIRRVLTPEPCPAEFDASFGALQQSANQRNVASVLEHLCRLVPEYRPSETALESRNRQESHLR